MKISFKWMLDKRFLGFLGLLALSLVIWFGADYVRFGADARSLGAVTRLVVILLLWVLWGLSLFIGQFRQARRNQAMVEDLVEASEPAANDEESRRLAERFQEALGLLRKARFQTCNGPRSLYQMPWYLLVGPPGAGKTTALINSGLRFPLLEQTGQHHLQGVGGTRNCDWWFTDEAVLIDTAGRYTTQDSNADQDRGGWQKFLELLGRYRPRRPVNGVIVAVSLHELMTSSRVERQERAAAVRARIQELMTRFHTRVPVYIWFTKVDLVAGFTTFYDDLTPAEREQVWGITFPSQMDRDASKTVAFFNAEYEALLGRINGRVMERLRQERELSRRARVLMFPAQMASLEPFLREFLDDLFADSRFEQPVILRGVYFTSGTQEGRPIDRVLSRLASQYGLEYAVEQNSGQQGRSYFLTRLLRDVIFPEAELGGVNARYEKRQRLLRLAGYAAIGLVFVFAISVWTGSLLTNRTLMSQVTRQINAFQNGLQQQGPPNGAVALADRLAPLFQATQVYRQVRHPWLSSLGLYNASVQETADAAYRAALDRLLRPQLLRDLQQSINNAKTNQALYDDVRVYLMLAEPRHRQNRDVVRWFERQWSASLPGQASRQARLVNYLGDWLNSRPGAQPVDKALLKMARERLKKVPIEERIYRQIQHRPEYARRLNMGNELGLSATGMFSPDSGVAAAALQIPWLYTKAGYKSLDLSPKSNIVHKYASEQWILGSTAREDFSDADVKQIVSRIRALYFTDYIDTWQRFLKALSIAPMHSLAQSGKRLLAASRIPGSPLYRVLQRLNQETELVPRPPSLDSGDKAGKAGKAVAALADKVSPPTPVDKAFASYHDLFGQNQAGPFFAALGKFAGQLQQFTMAPNAGQAAYRFARSRFAGQAQGPLQNLRSMIPQAPPRLAAWLTQLADYGWQQVLRSGSGYLDTQWRQNVADFCRTSLASAFPFRHGAGSDVALSDFAHYFAPGGVEDQFFKKSVAPFVQDGHGEHLASLDGQTLGVSRAALHMFARARAIRGAFFRSGKEPHLKFSLTPENLDKTVRRFELDLGGKSLAYSHGPKLPTRFNWPDGGTELSVMFEDINGTIHRKRWQGDWSLFRMLDQSRVRSRDSGRVYWVTVDVDGRKAILKLRAASTENPYKPGWLGRYRCLSRL